MEPKINRMVLKNCYFRNEHRKIYPLTLFLTGFEVLEIKTFIKRIAYIPFIFGLDRLTGN
jgi:hypothetical protein